MYKERIKELEEEYQQLSADIETVAVEFYKLGQDEVTAYYRLHAAIEFALEQLKRVERAVAALDGQVTPD